MYKTLGYWWVVAKRSAKAALPRSNDFQSYIGVPVLYLVTPLIAAWYGYFHAFSGSSITTGYSSVDTVISAAMAFLVTYVFIFAVYVVLVPARMHFEQMKALGDLHSELEAVRAQANHTTAIREQTEAIRQQTMALRSGHPVVTQEQLDFVTRAIATLSRESIDLLRQIQTTGMPANAPASASDPLLKESLLRRDFIGPAEIVPELRGAVRIRLDEMRYDELRGLAAAGFGGL